MPKLLVFAGPNGSGKSTVTAKFGTVGYYINADEIKKSLKCSDMEAAVTAERTRNYFLEHKKDFTFETVLSTDRNLKLISKAKQEGYYVTCVYVLTAHPDINVDRVKRRFENGGHNVPEDKVRVRYMRALRLFPLLIPLCNELLVFDNSVEKDKTESGLLFRKTGNEIVFAENNVWSTEMIKSLIDGTYPDKIIK